MRRFLLAAALAATIASVFSSARIARSCAPTILLREYLYPSFWQPLADHSLARRREATRQRTDHPAVAFAGLRTSPAPQAVVQARAAYRRLGSAGSLKISFATAQWAVMNAQKERLDTSLDLELQLIAAKCELQEANVGNEGLLRPLKTKLDRLVIRTDDPILASEARGWLAHVDIRLGDFAEAALIYMEELDREVSALDSETLLTSLDRALGMIGCAEACSPGKDLATQLAPLFDTPRHALLVIERYTRPHYSGEYEYHGNPHVELGTMLTLLDQRSRLLGSGVDADRLAVAAMRIALRSGDPARALRIGRSLSASSSVTQSPEALWLTGSAAFLTGEYAAAEEPLVRILGSSDASDMQRAFAQYGLVGIYGRLGRNTEMLHAAFEYGRRWGGYRSAPPDMPYAFVGEFFDLAYLLDVQVSDDELREYLVRYPDDRRLVFTLREQPSRITYTAHDLARHALAIRLARRERYLEAGAIFRSLRGPERADRMDRLAGLLADSRNQALTVRRRREVRLEYACYLADHRDQIFFNDTLWGGYQQAGLSIESGFSQKAPADVTSPEYTRWAEGQAAMERDRRFRDDQEELWRAALIFARLAREARGTPLGGEAAMRGYGALSRIAVERFGRKTEILKLMRELRAISGT